MPLFLCRLMTKVEVQFCWQRGFEMKGSRLSVRQRHQTAALSWSTASVLPSPELPDVDDSVDWLLASEDAS